MESVQSRSDLMEVEGGMGRVVSVEVSKRVVLVLVLVVFLVAPAHPLLVLV
eukprot:CAMPEP_0196742470 /NCGR_PEP_ID=MMETSP1091-20130531/47078_1 /TAXON_ID=302021 /ORGANISM="Rhodomonas sp., Strain CCMP768" /LENGTH=50 /DNA_ID=CAMNT_0042088533 /DNA_START=81 /DNA_END=230 /DNA_ORIENTATION=+